MNFLCKYTFGLIYMVSVRVCGAGGWEAWGARTGGFMLVYSWIGRLFHASDKVPDVFDQFWLQRPNLAALQVSFSICVEFSCIHGQIVDQIINYSLFSFNHLYVTWCDQHVLMIFDKSLVNLNFPVEKSNRLALLHDKSLKKWIVNFTFGYAKKHVDWGMVCKVTRKVLYTRLPDIFFVNIFDEEKCSSFTRLNVQPTFAFFRFVYVLDQQKTLSEHILLTRTAHT